MSRWVMLAAVLCITFGIGHARAETMSGGRYGDVHVSRPTGPIRGFAVLFSAMTGWSAADQQAADTLAQHDMIVVGVDTGRYAATLATINEACHYIVGDAEAISHQLQRELGDRQYFTPIVAGISDGGRLAEAVLSAAPSNTIAGAASIDPAAALDARFKSCPPDPTIIHDPGLPGFWSIATTADVSPPIQTMVADLRKLGARVDVQSFAAGTPEGTMLLALTERHLGPRAPDEEDVSDLPLIELPAERPSPMLAIIISGDGGWRDLDKTIARNLHGSGVSVVGVDSLRYFWSKKTPARTAHDLARIMHFYGARWHATSIALIGYSFGADVLPFAYNRLAPRDREHVALMSLLGFASAADFEIRVTGWLGLPPSSAALPVQSEIAKVPPALVQCFYGDEETDTICPELARLRMAVIRTSGSHHFGRDYEHLARVILNGWRRRLTGG